MATDETRMYKTFIISIVMVIALILSGMFFAISIVTRQLIEEEVVIHARALFDSILLTREWNARHGGVYVEKKEGVESNPYLENPDIKTIDGKIYTKRNPAMMTRKISEYSERKGLFKFHLSSLTPVNPNNRPDEFEGKTLNLFKKGVKEVFREEQINNRTFFRYMAPLDVKEECLTCHVKQGYKLGDVRGGISISFDIEDIRSKVKSYTFFIILFGIVTALLLAALIYFFMWKLIKKISRMRQHLEDMSITDMLTGIFNRRYVMSRFIEEFKKAKRLARGLSCIMIDMDHFKDINDKYGHLVGDAALREVSGRIKNAVRIYDVPGRYGGEEFLIVLPDTDLADAAALAERIRLRVKDISAEDVSITISLGVTCLQEKDNSVDDMIKKADTALYQAKAAGRDRVEWLTA
ncbi:MAG: diguanylate cyclase [Nitrospirae bacterium]|nr:diguanylate cyclase [Nitrospirota bacterium]